MRKRLNVVLSTVALSLAAVFGSRGDNTVEYSVQVSASVEKAPVRITLNWLQDTVEVPNNYTIYRRAPGASSWGNGISLPGTATVYSDNNVLSGTPYEYQIVKKTSTHTGYGYIYAGVNVPATEVRGTLLLVVDHTYASDLTTELNRLQQDLVGDGWTVERFDVDRSDSPEHVKELIKTRYDADPDHVKAVFLFGHVPVPYSGNIVPDGHYREHEGAWPCDGYYADMDGTWTDNSVNDTNASDPRNHNVPNDGKFDQSTFPAPLKLMLGRVDLANMPGRMTRGGPATFPSELELLRNYLDKDHNFRRKITTAPERAIVGDYFGARDGEAFAASGWRNFAPFFGAANITTLHDEGTWISTLRTNAYLWAYGCGSGSYTSIGGIGSVGQYDDGVTTELVENNVKAIFTMLYGSWLGDWDSEDNIQRAVLATGQYGLTCAWSGRPHWFMQHMALGEPIGFSTLITQNNGFTGLYRNQRNNCANWIHIALMGDPTLRMQIVAPPSTVEARPLGNNTALTWQPSKDSIEGYNVYRAVNPSGPFSRLNWTPVASTTFIDRNPGAGCTYMVRAVKLETSASGTYFNLSEGEFASSAVPQDIAASTNREPVAQNTTPAAVSSPATTEPKITPTGKSDGQKLSPTGATSGTGATDTTWVDDSVPTGAVRDSNGGDSWTGISSNPSPESGAVAFQSAITSGLHQLFFTSATQTLPVNTGDSLYTYIYIDPANPPTEVMLQWNDGSSWEHRAYWGTKSVYWGTDGTASSRNMGSLPATGQWVRLEVPASQLGLEGSTVSGMAFTLFDGRATWDNAGKASSSGTVTPPATNNPPVVTNNPPAVDTNLPPVVNTNPPSTTGSNPPTAPAILITNALLPGTTVVDDIALRMPKPGEYALHVLSPTLLELRLINTKDPDPAQVTQWNWVNNFVFSAPPMNALAVTANGQTVGVQSIGFKRRPLYAPLIAYDLRIDNSLYLQLSAPISDNQTITVKNPDGTLWGTNMQFSATVDPLRYSPAIHVNQEGYMPNYSKKAMVGYYTGSMGEMDILASSGFKLVDANTGSTVYQGSLVQRSDVGYLYSPTPYQKVYEADFTGFNTPGQYRLVVPGMGASLPFNITEGIAMDFARTYALGLYHQRCGTNNALPYTRFTHDNCHTAPAAVPASSSQYPFTWTTIANYAQISNPDNPVSTAPKLTGPSAQLFPFVNQGPLDVSGGHHDAGDYSKYTLNSVALIHYLTFAVDSMPGVAALDNLGIPESGDGISDVLQEAKWEADFLAKMQDSDGGFYFLVYPQNREYESNVTPDHGDPQVVWPKTSSATASSVAALAEIGSSPKFKQAYPQTAALYMQKALLGWQFLTNAIARYGKNGIYQKITHYGDDFADYDELAWAASAMFVATGDPQYQQTLFQWFPDPTNPATFRWGWWRLFACYGNAVRSYAFAVRSGRLQANQVDAAYLAKCESVITAAGDDLVTWSKQSAYGTSFPEATKHVQGAGWYFSGDQTFDITTAYQINPKPDYMTAILANMNYEGGCNPVNTSYVTGLGWKRQRDAVSQYAANDRRVLPPTGQPMGNVSWGFSYLDNYKGSLGNLCFPSDNATSAPYPFYDRWGDSWNVSTEFVAFQQARSLATYAFLAAQTSLKTQPWKAVQGQIVVPPGPLTGPITFSLQAPGVDLTSARIAWEPRDGDPGMGQTFTFMPKNNGSQWIEAEALLPDGRRVFAAADFTADTPNVVWVDDNLPAGANGYSDGGDSWTWVSSSPTPTSGSLAHQSIVGTGMHQHFFRDATATMKVSTGAVLYAYIYLDPANPPTEAMLQWNDGSWEHRAYWGANNLAYGTDGTASCRNMGALPAAGQWAQLKIPASQVGLEGSTVTGMAFTLFNGRATWDAAGELNPSVTNTNGGSGSNTNNGSGSNTNGTGSGGGTTNTTLPTLTLTSVDGSRVGPVAGKFTLVRTGNTNSALTVAYSLTGTATGGVDYQAPQTTSNAIVAIPSVTIPAGATSATVDISPLATTNLVDSRSVTFTPVDDGSYNIGTASNATLMLIGNTVSAPTLKWHVGNPALIWSTVPGAVYRIAYKNSLADTNWTYMTNTVSAVGVTSYWSDTNKASQRFYSIVRIK